MENSIFELQEPKVDYGDLIAEFEAIMLVLGIWWGRAPVSTWLTDLVCPSRHFLSLDDYELLIERDSIALAEGGGHG